MVVFIEDVALKSLTSACWIGFWDRGKIMRISYAGFLLLRNSRRSANLCVNFQWATMQLHNLLGHVE